LRSNALANREGAIYPVSHPPRPHRRQGAAETVESAV
jgi:hypothetical protein